MHQAGEAIIAEGYPYVVSITNYCDENGVYRTATEDFMSLLDDDQCQDNTPPWGQSSVVYYKGHECKWAIQDGELPGLGIYVFFKDEAAAELCRRKYVFVRNLVRSNRG